MGKGLHREGRAKKAEEISLAMPVSDSAIAEEREKARELRASQWWQAQIASGRCHYCGRIFKPSELTMDHIIPVARGGKSDRRNVVPCCKQCNNEKKWLTPAEQILRQLGDWPNPPWNQRLLRLFPSLLLSRSSPFFPTSFHWGGCGGRAPIFGVVTERGYRGTDNLSTFPIFHCLSLWYNDCVSLHFNNVAFAYDGMAGNLLEDVDAYFYEGTWTGIVGANGAGKTTLLKLASGALVPSSGKIESRGSAQYVVQRTDFPPDGLDDFLLSPDGPAVNWRIRLGADEGWVGRWDSLSHGERKRAQIAFALWHEPDVLALDEPTNHLDETTKVSLLDALRDYHGTGLIVCHDRDFLDALCSRCLFIFPPRATMRPGGVSEGLAQDCREQEFRRARNEAAKSEAHRLRATAQRRLELAQQLAAKNRPKREARIDPQDHDGRAKRQLAKLTGKNSWAVSQSAAVAKRAAKAEAEMRAATARKEYKTGFWLDGSEASQRDCVLFAPAGTLRLGDGRILRYPEIRLAPDARIAITGDNGIGKSTFLRHLLGFARVSPEKLLSVPQEIPEAETRRILAEVKGLDRASLGRVMTSVSRLGSRPGRLLESECPSPGELRKILLALGVNRGIHLLAMDEPTNHLDLPGIECLEEALEACPCAMILVSHDRRFLSRLSTAEWRLAPGDEGAVEVRRIPRG